RTHKFNASFPYRASAIYGSILAQAGIDESFFDANPKELKTELQQEVATKIYEVALAQYVRNRIRRNTIAGKGLFASIGLLDTTDPTMGHIKNEIVDAYK